MKKVQFGVMVICLFSIQSKAQEFPRVEIFGGYSYSNLDGPELLDRQHFHGWGASLTGNFSPAIGLTAQFTGAYGTVEVPGFAPDVDLRAHGFLFGPEFSVRRDRARFFAHPLIGLLYSKATIEGGEVPDDRIPILPGPTTFAWAFGGGLDVAASRTVAFRVVQFDYVGERGEDETATHFRIAAGIVFRFGGQ